MNYCDDNGCQNRKRNHLEGNEPTDNLSNISDAYKKSCDSKTITLKKETAEEIILLINNLINGKQPYYKKQKEALKVLESKLV
jgi:hypothetical protein